MNISKEVDQWIAEEELPVHPFLRPISRFDGIYPEDDDEREAYFDFLKWFMQLDYLLLMDIRSSCEEEFK